MKNTFKKIVSIVLTVLMVAGTFAMLVPTVSAANDYVTITPNTDFVHNGVTYRFDVQSGNTESYAHILADGSVEFKLADGDFLWFPDIQATDSSAIHAKVTAIDRLTSDGGMSNLFAGLIYGYDSTKETGVGAIIKTNKNYRITNITRSALAGHNGSDGYGSGGDRPRIKDGTASSAAGVYTSSTSNWKFGTSVTFDISKDGENVNVKLSGTELFADASYSVSEGYSFAGAVGFAPVWSATAEDRYSTFRFDELTLTNCTVKGEEKDAYTVFGRNTTIDSPIYLEKNKTATIGGVTYRFDTQTPDDENVWARLNPDGTWEVSIRNGDMLWFPGVEATANSVIYGEFTNTLSGCVDLSSGIAYGIKSEGGTYTTGSSAVIRTGKRIRVTPISSNGLYGYNGSDGYGNGGDSPRYIDGKTLTENAAYNAMKGSNGNWGGGKTVYFKLSSADGNANIEMGAQNKGSFYNGTYSLSTYPAGALTGSVGFVVSYQDGQSTLTQIRYDDITITNCKVNGKDVDSYSIKTAFEPEPEVPTGPSETIYLEKNKTATIGGVTYRFDTQTPDDENVWARINTDGTWEVSIRNGDMLWFPGVEATDRSGIYAEFTNTKTSPINLSSGIAYGIKSEGGTYTTGSSAVIRTGKRIRVTPISSDGLYGYNGGDGYGNGGDQSRYLDNKTLIDNPAYGAVKNATNGNWDGKKTVYFKVSPANGNANIEMGAPGIGSFYNGTYSLSTYPAGSIAGSVGFVVSYQVEEETLTQIRYDNITITNCKVNGEEVDSYKVKAVFEQKPIEGEMISLSLDGTIGLNFAFKAKAALLQNATIVAKKNGVEVVNQAVVDGENVVTVPVAAKEMTDDVNFAILVDGEVFEEHSYTTSVAAYANQIMADDNYNEWDELIGAMLNYGAAAQKLFDYKADALAPGASAEVDFDFSDYSAVEFSGEKSILKGLFVNLSLESETTLKVYFMPAEGVELDVTVNGKDAALTDNGDGYYVLSIAGIAADKLDDDFAIVVNDQLSFSVNAFDWARLATNNSDANVANAARALAAYGVAAGKKF